jgi:hypothetical protein
MYEYTRKNVEGVQSYRHKRCRFWVDAICIDQAKNQASLQEKACQLDLMANIYSRLNVLIWLGPAGNDSDDVMLWAKSLWLVDNPELSKEQYRSLFYRTTTELNRRHPWMPTPERWEIELERARDLPPIAGDLPLDFEKAPFAPHTHLFWKSCAKFSCDLGSIEYGRCKNCG